MRRKEYPTRIALCGFSGSGKSTIAPLLARQLKYDTVDIDAEIEARAGMHIRDYFRLRGEAAFRRAERSAVRAALRRNDVVIALGGGALLDASTARLVRSSAMLIYLSCSIRELNRRLRDQIDRPLLGANTNRPGALRTRTEALLEKRKPGYLSAALRISTTTHPPRTVADAIVRRLAQVNTP